MIGLLDDPHYIGAISRYSGLSNDEKSSEAKQMYHYFIANTDFHYLPDFLLDPIVEKLGNALIDEILF